MLLVCRFTVAETGVEAFTGRVDRALALLTAQPGCRRAQLSRSTDEADRFVLTVEFDSVVAYRRALSPFEVREHVIPLLSEANADEPAAYEPLLVAADGAVRREVSLLARDAGTVRLGEAAGPTTPR
ncbi:antibiotic biosynthesis monooxygenase family protein [Saccharothrix luteola]|uniref:antibiotic biosynthesis monooxygenase family protein n=1 Tax=Saccharothrix luteola TaxID=2893018 RepID=UPI001E365142|nr:antibiotic biosynthesis monooxygenase family protein [Saccharothrix luteola]MCC8244851.1 antibiotic biosynthesis monooxygenase [Saccharothrix luteola]